MAKKKTRVNIKMQSTKSPHYYTTTTNPANNGKKLELMKYDPTLNKKVLYRQARKIK
jgi:large subunit ribosomal protein L33|tara:strand:+ start:711 stop:881 length:171 start_codon:yes stop_codon:yes gene_type:complete